MTNLTHDSLLCVYFDSLHVSSNLVLIIRRINCINATSGMCHSVSVTFSCAPTQSDIYQMLYWYNWFSCWWARGCSKHVQNWNKHIEKNCASSSSFNKNHSKMHGQQTVKIPVAFLCWYNVTNPHDLCSLSVQFNAFYIHILCFRACYMYCLSYHLRTITTIILHAKKNKVVPVHRIKAYEVAEV
jgi:hypothetical protein